MIADCNITANGVCFSLNDSDIATIFVFRNGNVAVCDRNGQQVVEMQGTIEELLIRAKQKLKGQGE